MLNNLPFSGDFSILRAFGTDSPLFSQVDFQQQPLQGHTGIDLAAPAQTPVYAAQEGQVLRARIDSGGNTDKNITGFGGYVLLRHTWGQTLYARLEDIQVAEGAQIDAGTHLGNIAEATPALASHLHFGMRIVPYSLQDGWAGFVDPRPYLQRISTPLGPIIGPHIIATIRPHLPTLARWQPRMILVLDPNPDEARELRQTCPNSVIIARLYHPEHEIEQRIRQNPQTAAQWAHEKVMAHYSPYIDYWQIANELLQDAAGLPLLDHFERARMQLADRHGYKCAILAFSVGNPDLPESDRMAHWRRVYPALAYAEEHGHIVAIHQYGMPTLWGPNNAYDWYIHRLEHQVLRRLPYKKLQFAVTEYGIDGLIQGNGPAGWQTFTQPEDYAAQLMQAGRYLERFSGRVLGYAIFTLGHYMPWNTYDIAGPVAETLAGGLDRGVWADVDTHVTSIAPRESDSTTSPGPEALPPLPEDENTDDDATTGDDDPNLEDDPDATEEVDGDSGAGPADEDGDDDQTEDEDREAPESEDNEDDIENGEDDTAEDESGEPEDKDDAEEDPPDRKPKFQMVRRLSRWVEHYNIAYTEQLQSILTPTSQSAEAEDDDLIFLVKDIFTTRNGSWEPDQEPGSITHWARADYLRPLGAPDYFDDAGGDHHLFGAVLGVDGELMRLQPIAYWSDGVEQVENPNYAGYVLRATKEGSGWANIAIGPGSSFVPERGESGPWCWAPIGEAEIACGGGLPANHHISTFVVWQAVHRADLFPEDIYPEEGEREDEETQDGETDDGDPANGDQDADQDTDQDEENTDDTIYIPVVIR